VDELHSIENKGVRNHSASIDIISGWSKTHSFFDITEVFPVGGESGAQVSSPQSGSGWKSPVPITQVSDAGMYR
jgi:hypothetical protein